MSKKAVEKGKAELGMNPSTANGRLVKDLLYKFICEAGKNSCFHCKKEMSRETFSIEHKVPWRSSINALELFFDLENISFSHLKCNCAAARPSSHRGGSKNKGIIRVPCPSDAGYSRGCRCDGCKSAHNKRIRERYNPERRKRNYNKGKK